VTKRPCRHPDAPDQEPDRSNQHDRSSGGNRPASRHIHRGIVDEHGVEITHATFDTNGDLERRLAGITVNRPFVSDVA